MFGKAYKAIGSALGKVFNPIARGVSRTAQVYNQLPPEAKAIVSRKAGDVAQGVRDTYPPAVRTFLEDGGEDVPVHSLEIVIEPLAPVVEILANKMTGGEASAYAHQRGFDGFFHVALIVNGKYSIEKHKEGVYVGPEVPRGVNNPKVRVQRKHINVSRRLTIGSMLDATHKMMGDPAYFSYDLLKNNCAVFVEKVLQANGLLTSDSKAFVNQDIAGLSRKMPGFAPAVAKVFTNLTNLVSIAQTGR
jgi:hypothetical protein